MLTPIKEQYTQPKINVNLIEGDQSLPEIDALSSERMRASPHRVQELINRYNLNNLKKTLNLKPYDGNGTIGSINRYKKPSRMNVV